MSKGSYNESYTEEEWAEAFQRNRINNFVEDKEMYKNSILDYKESVRSFYRNFYDHGVTARIEHPDKINVLKRNDPYQESLGLDFKKTPEGEWELIEITPDFGAKGFGEAYLFGPIKDEIGSQSIFDKFKDRFAGIPFGGSDLFLDLAHKNIMADVLESGRDYETIETFEGNPESDILFLKNPSAEGGGGVEVVEAESFKDNPRGILNDNFDSIDNVMIEENVPSEGVIIKGDEYDCCMRYVVDITVDHKGMDASFLGGYWRTARKPKERDAPLQDRFLANLDHGKAVPAIPKELREATLEASQITEEIYSALVQETLEKEITPENAERYLPDIETTWEDKLMTSSFGERLFNRPDILEEDNKPENIQDPTIRPISEDQNSKQILELSKLNSLKSYLSKFL